MRLTYFYFKNFKGIESLRLDLRHNPNSKVYTFVGLNESGKTTILEAIKHFVFKTESLNALQLDRYKIEDMHDIIINKLDNFNIKKKLYKQKTRKISFYRLLTVFECVLSGPDGTRTRDLRRDRAAF